MLHQDDKEITKDHVQGENCRMKSHRYRHTTRIAALAMILCVVCWLQGGSISTAKEGKSLDPAKAGQLQQTLDETINSLGIPGAVFAVQLNNGSQWIGVSGVSDREQNTPMQPQDQFRIGSITKTFVATAILLLVEDGKINLTDTLKDWLPDLNVPNDDTITIKNLLNMTSGVFSYLSDPNFFGAYYTNPGQTYTPEQLVQAALPFSPIFEPGQAYSYSNSNYILLGLIAEKAAGAPLPEQIQKRILDQLQMQSSTFPSTPAFSGGYTHGYTSEMFPDGSMDPNKILDFSNASPTAAWAAGAMVSNATDLMTWIIATVKGTLLSPQTQQMRIQGVVGELGEVGDLCYGLGLMEADFGAAKIIGHGGAILGYKGSMVYWPEQKAYTVVLINRFVVSEQVEGTFEILAAMTSVLFEKPKQEVPRALVQALTAMPTSKEGKTRREKLKELGKKLKEKADRGESTDVQTCVIDGR
jgi:D-alanyl-D-alanine carboxypeptidase